MDTELLKGTLSLLILSLLSRKAMYGYEIAATVHRDTDGTFTWREGSLYPSLHKMEADGLIAGAWEEKETGRKRKYYGITDKGRAALTEKVKSWNELCLAVNSILEKSDGQTERYLDEVCRSIGGPRSLRQHVRQELGEHLRDAAARYKADGLSEAEALERALTDFGGPEEVRSELEAAHGHRLLPVVIDKAMQWKETTVRAKWLWTTWAYFVAVGVILVNLVFLAYAGSAGVARLNKIRSDGWIDETGQFPVVQSLSSFLDAVSEVRANWAWLALLIAVAWGVFEWLVRSENKSMMRLAAMGTAALGLSIAVFFSAAALVLPFQMGMPGLLRTVVRPLAAEQMLALDTSVEELDLALAKKDWGELQKTADRASRATASLQAGVVALGAKESKLSPGALREQLGAAKGFLDEARQAIARKDEARSEAAVRKFHDAYGRVRESTEPGN